jgi:hypothetical protein
MTGSGEAVNNGEEVARQIAAELGKGWEVKTEYPVGIEFDYVARRGVVDVSYENPPLYLAEILPNGYYGHVLAEAEGPTATAALAALKEAWADYAEPVDESVRNEIEASFA